MSEDTHTEPILPPEIEEVIFSLCARTNPEECRNLILVAHRVYQWLIPQLYEVAILHSERPAGRPKLSYELLEKYGYHVRHLLFWDHPMFMQMTDANGIAWDLARCLSACPNVVDLALWGREVRFEALIDQLLGIRQLRRLSIDIHDFHLAMINLGRSTSTSPAITFPAVTHLEVMCIPIDLSMQEIKEYFPALTHLVVCGLMYTSIQSILDCWGDQLEVLILYDGSSAAVDAAQVDDSRIAVVPNSYEFVWDWNEATTEAPNSIWRQAEEVIAHRRELRSSLKQ